MPQIGEIRKANEIGRVGTHKFIWFPCSVCEKPRWVILYVGTPKDKMCYLCAMRRQRIETSYNPNPPKLGEIRRSGEVGRKGKYKLLWSSCLVCGNPRWVKLSRGITLRSEKCKLCVAKINGRLSKSSGANNPNWQGGIGRIPYSWEFNQQLRTLIRLRDAYTCQKCGMPECENGRKLSIHHIDYDKQNCLPTNLISLCCICSSVVNFNREYWTEYFRGRLNELQLNPKKLKIKYTVERRL